MEKLPSVYVYKEDRTRLNIARAKTGESQPQLIKRLLDLEEQLISQTDERSN